MADRITERALAVFRECYPATDRAAEWDESALRARTCFVMGFCVALTSSPWVPIEECGGLERGRYLVQLRSGAQIVALWSGDSEGWVLRQRDLDEFDSPRDITHVHQMGPIRGPGEAT